MGAKEVGVVEGNYDHKWTVVVKFPLQESATSFYGSPEYHAVIPERHKAANTNTSILLLDAQFKPPAK